MSIPICILLFGGVWIQRFQRIISNRLDDAKPFSPSLSEEYSIASRKVLWPLDKTECDCSAVTRTDECPVDIDDGACLGHRPDVQHCLVFRLDGGGVA